MRKNKNHTNKPWTLYRVLHWITLVIWVGFGAAIGIWINDPRATIAVMVMSSPVLIAILVIFATDDEVYTSSHEGQYWSDVYGWRDGYSDPC